MLTQWEEIDEPDVTHPTCEKTQRLPIHRQELLSVFIKDLIAVRYSVDDRTHRTGWIECE